MSFRIGDGITYDPMFKRAYTKAPNHSAIITSSGQFVGFGEALRKAMEELGAQTGSGIDSLVAEPYRIEVVPTKCTCGVHATGGLHSDWCDVSLADSAQ